MVVGDVFFSDWDLFISEEPDSLEELSDNGFFEGCLGIEISLELGLSENKVGMQIIKSVDSLLNRLGVDFISIFHFDEDILENLDKQELASGDFSHVGLKKDGNFFKSIGVSLGE